jgi:hypothetical protein
MSFVDFGVPLAAIEFSTVLGIAMLIIAFLGWLRQQIIANQPPPPPPGPRRRPPRREDRVQNEIDQFLQEVGGRREPDPEDVPIEIVPESEIRERRPVRRPPPRRPQRQPVVAVEEPGPPSPPIAEVEPPSRRLGTLAPAVPAQAVELTAAERFEQQLARPMGQIAAHPLGRLAQHQLRPLAEQQAVQPTGSPADPAAQLAALQMQKKSPGVRQKVAGLFRDPESMRQAMIINAILTPPRSRRR